MGEKLFIQLDAMGSGRSLCFNFGFQPALYCSVHGSVFTWMLYKVLLGAFDLDLWGFVLCITVWKQTNIMGSVAFQNWDSLDCAIKEKVRSYSQSSHYLIRLKNTYLKLTMMCRTSSSIGDTECIENVKINHENLALFKQVKDHFL